MRRSIARLIAILIAGSALAVTALAVTALAVTALAGVAIAFGPAGVAVAQGGAEGERPACVQVSAAPRMQAYGWNHVVVVQNRCEAPVDCRVASDVDPTPIAVRVDRGQTSETLTRRGSPASAFVARADCTLAR